MNKKKTKHLITFNNKKYPYSISSSYKDEGEDVVYFECPAAAISQPFLAEDIPALLIDLPELIIAEKNYQKKTKEIIRFRLAVEEKKAIEKKAARLGYSSVSSFLRDVALKA
ncbi:hypothetical protein HOG17_01960 [Candidatus Peregrinibacteria bacterium]|jgi:hypothetical protein|nr:hypothetical protein [Candidatus Peregrinibacteria bacterium]MBT4148488.1 hypothetical protein [Candidatus Peregrinibacteria bacterium]MBT4456422.1 hypothetical protein [Candidatus Peregrinibacteria bacterium]